MCPAYGMANGSAWRSWNLAGGWSQKDDAPPGGRRRGGPRAAQRVLAERARMQRPHHLLIPEAVDGVMMKCALVDVPNWMLDTCSMAGTQKRAE